MQSNKLLTEMISFSTEEAALNFIFKYLNPLSDNLIKAARQSETYKNTLKYLNTLDKDLEIEVYISLSGRNFNKIIMHLGEEIRGNIQNFFKDFTNYLTYLYEDRIIANISLFKEIQINGLTVKDIPYLQKELSIFHRIDMKLPPLLPEEDDTSGREIYTVYGINNIEKSYNIILNKVSIKKEKEDLDQDQYIKDQETKEKEDQLKSVNNNLSYDKFYEYINIDQSSLPDLTGPFLLKWS